MLSQATVPTRVSHDYVALVREHGSRRKAAAAIGMAVSTFLRRLSAQAASAAAVAPQKPRVRVKAGTAPVVNEMASALGGQEAHPETRTIRRNGRRFILTSAQNNTRVHEKFLAALLVMARVESAELLVSRFTYNASTWEREAGVTTASEGVVYDPKLEPYLTSVSTRLAPDLVFCAEVTKLPTAVNPLSGLDSYTGSSSGVVGHPKVAMQSFAGLKQNPPRILYSTGCCTQRHYVDRFAGQKAAFHHVFGALFVEVDEDGYWFARQLVATEDGAFQDLNTVYSPLGAHPARVSAVIWGDIHRRFLESEIRESMFGPGGIYDTLKPRFQVKHDVMHFLGRSHHSARDPFAQAEFLRTGDDRVEAEVREDARFLVETEGDEDCLTLVPDANHHCHLRRWLSEADFRSDPVNARYGHYLSYRLHEAIEAGRGRTFDVYEFAVREAAEAFGGLKRTRFLGVDESVVVAGVELGIHGDRGPNGARGSPKAFRQLGRRSVTGHTHTAGIVDGVYTVGVSAALDQGYNKGPSSWSQTHCILYANGKRALVTQRGPRWRGEPLDAEPATFAKAA